MRALSGYMAKAPQRALPGAVEEKTKHHIADSLAAIISGSALLPGRIAIGHAKRLGGTNEACICGTRIMTSVINAAFANGMSAHADETDDSHQAAFFHPGCAIVPAALAMAEREHAGGNEMLRAVALGYDVGARFNFAFGAMDFHLAGHSSHSFGALFGATAAAGALARFDGRRMRWLLSYAAQQASGVACWMRDPDHIEKAFTLGGMTARNAVAAADMVAHGFSAVEDVLSGERNLLFAFDAESRADALTHELGKTYEIMNANIKKWSVGSPVQAALDSMQALVRDHGISAADATRIKVQVQDREAAIVNDRDRPDICMQHLLAVMLLDGDVTFDSSHDVERMHDRRVLDVRRRIEFVGSPALTRAGGRQAIVEVWTRDGRHLKHHTAVVKGAKGNAMTREEVHQKCMALIVPISGQRRARELLDAVWHLETVQDMRSLRPLLQAHSRTTG